MAMAASLRLVALQADAVLRGRSFEFPRSGSAGRLLLVTMAGGALYGADMGSYGGWDDGRYWQAIFSAIKVPVFILGTFLISLSAFFLASTLLGLRRDFAASLEALLAAQAAVAIVLAALSPYKFFWYTSLGSYNAALLFNLAVFGVASLAALAVLRARSQALVARNRLHRVLLRLWLALYALVGIQMAWVLRQFLVASRAGVEFVREEAWGNAYEVVWRLLWKTLVPRCEPCRLGCLAAVR